MRPACDTPETAFEVYTAVRAAIEPDAENEQRFLHQLRDGLHIDPKLAAQVDAQVSGRPRAGPSSGRGAAEQRKLWQ